MVALRGTARAIGVSLLLLATACGDEGYDKVSANSTIPLTTASVPASTTIAPAAPGALLPTDAMAAPTDPKTPIDLATAERVFQALYPLRTQAIHEHRADIIGAIETGAAREYDLARCRTKCPEAPPVTGEVPHTFSAPPQTGYPAFFFARATRPVASGGQAHEHVVFTRATRADPWLIALTGGTGLALPVLDDANAGFGREAPRLPGPRPVGLPVAMAAYWQHWLERGSAPPDNPFIIVPEVEKRGAAIAGSPAGNEREGRKEVRKYTADPTVYTVSGSNGTAFTCGSLRLDERFTSVSGEPLVQGPARIEWGPDLAPGRYREIVVKLLEQDCFYVQPDGRAGPFYSDPIATSTTGTLV